MFIYIESRRGLIRAGSPSSSSPNLGDTFAQKKESRCFYTSGFLYQLLPCAAGATFSAYEYLFLLYLVLGRVMDGVYLNRSDYGA